MAILNFTVKRVKKRRDRFAEVIGIKLKCNNSVMQKEMRREMEIRGEFPLSLDEGDQFEVEVNKKMDFKYSMPYFEVVPGSQIKRTGLESKKVLAKFLQTKINSSPRKNPKLQKWKISLPCCEKIIENVGNDVFNKIIDNRVDLLQYPELKLTQSKVDEIQRILSDYKEIQKIVVALQASKLPLRIIFQLYNTYGERTLTTILDNPYQICYDEQLTFRMADKVAFDAGFKSDDSIRVRTAIMDYVKHQVQGGSTCISVASLFNNTLNKTIENLNDYLNFYSAYKFNMITDEQIEKELEQLIEDQKLIYYSKTCNSVSENHSGFLYLPKQYKIETHLANVIKDINNNAYNCSFCSVSEANDFLDMYEQQNNFSLDSQQRLAVVQAMNNKIFILTGGPGTGKTMTVSVIVKCIKYISANKYHKDPNFKLVAPTGKAAERMNELTNEPASTIHRALHLGFNGTTDAELDYDFLIVDEGSMIDQELMDILLSSVSMQTRIIIVGDSNQLPSVGPGRVLEELIRSSCVACLELQTIFRQANGSAIVEASKKICEGLDSHHTNGIILTNNPSSNFKFIEDKTIEGIKAELVSRIDNLIANGVSISAIQVLTPKRNGELGILTLNDIMQERYNPNPILYEDENTGLRLKVGDKVIQTSNNYDLKVFNGFIGTVTFIDDTHVKNGVLDPIITVEYDGCDAPVDYSGAFINELELAYVLTIHKSQGSEYQYVFIPMHFEQEVMLNRKLLYTAVTRAKKECTIMGEKEAVNYAINMQMDENRRLTNLTEFIIF